MPRDREPPPSTIAALIQRLETHLRRLQTTRASTSACPVVTELPASHAVVESLQSLLTTLRRLDSEVSLFRYLEEERARRPHQGLTWQELSQIPGISDGARACFRRPDGRAVGPGVPLRVEWCIEPRIAPHIYPRYYLAKYVALSHNCEILGYFAMQLQGVCARTRRGL